jgi:adenosylhomocysteine nucleosidase
LEVNLIPAEREPAANGIEIGFVFALPMEAAGIVDVLTEHQTTRGDGRTFHTGLFGNRRVAVIESGIGQEKARRAAEVLIDVFAPKRLCSAGYAGGLSKRLKQLNVCFPEQVMRDSDAKILDLTGSIPKYVENGTEPKLTLLTADSMVDSPQKKRVLGERTGAELVDMETFAAADVCRERNVPFLSVRIILDTAEEQIPKEIQRISQSAAKGKIRLAGSVLGALFSRPSSMLDLLSLQRRALMATDRLAKRIKAELG